MSIKYIISNGKRYTITTSDFQKPSHVFNNLEMVYNRIYKNADLMSGDTAIDIFRELPGSIRVSEFCDNCGDCGDCKNMQKYGTFEEYKKADLREWTLKKNEVMTAKAKLADEQRITCECGAKISKSNKSHKKTKKHLDYLNKVALSK